MRTIYLAGPMENVTEAEAKGWRDVATSILYPHGIKTLDPTRRLHQDDKKAMRRIFELDLRDIRESDIILVNLNNPTMAKNGTAMEVFYASYVLRKPVVAFKVESAHWHPFFEALVTEWKSTVEKACDTIVKEYL